MSRHLAQVDPGTFHSHAINPCLPFGCYCSQDFTADGSYERQKSGFFSLSLPLIGSCIAESKPAPGAPKPSKAKKEESKKEDGKHMTAPAPSTFICQPVQPSWLSRECMKCFRDRNVCGSLITTWLQHTRCCCVKAPKGQRKA